MKLPLIKNKSKTASADELSLRSLQVIERKLAQNTLTEFKLGFEVGEIQSKRELQSLTNTIRERYLHQLSIDKISSLERIRIGWNLPRFALAPLLQEIIPLLLQPPARIKYLQLALDAFVPLSTLKNLVSSSSILCLDLRMVKIRTRSVSDPRPTNRKHKATLGTLSSRTDDTLEERITSSDENVLSLLPHLSRTIRALTLADCGLQSHHIPELIRHMRHKRHVQILSLRHNQLLRLDGWESVLLRELPFLKCLDLSLCDLDPLDGIALASAFEKAGKDKGSHLCRLSLAGNYRLDSSVPKVVEASARNGLIEIDCSFCDVHNKTQQQVFRCLTTAQPCTLRSLKMQAVRIKDSGPLVECIRNNTPLERLILNHPREPYHISTQSMEGIKEAVKSNFYLKDFAVDIPWDQDERSLDEMEYWLNLNRCGRSIFVQDESQSWPEVLAKASALGNRDIVYWFLKNGASLF